jgi:hypothetical protein
MLLRQYTPNTVLRVSPLNSGTGLRGATKEISVRRSILTDAVMNVSAERAGINYDNIPEEVRAQIRGCFLDMLKVMVIHAITWCEQARSKTILPQDVLEAVVSTVIEHRRTLDGPRSTQADDSNDHDGEFVPPPACVCYTGDDADPYSDQDSEDESATDNGSSFDCESDTSASDAGEASSSSSSSL